MPVTCAQLVQVADEGQRVQPVAQGVGAHAQRQVPGAGGRYRLVSVAAAAAAAFVRRCAAATVGAADALQRQRQRAALFHQFGRRRALAHLGQQLFHAVAALQQQRHALVGHRQLAGAHQLQHAFHFVREAHHRVVAEQARGALDGVGGAEGAVHGLGVGRVLLHRQQAVLELAQHVLRFGQEALSGGRDDVVVGTHGVLCPQAAAPNT